MCISAPSEVEAMMQEKDGNDMFVENCCCFKMFNRFGVFTQKRVLNFCSEANQLSLSMMLGKCSSRMRYMCSIGMKSSSISLCLA